MSLRYILGASRRQAPALLMSGGAAVKLQSISDLPFETVETLIFDGLLQLQSKKVSP